MEVSLCRLRTDYIDLLQLHRPDPDTPLDETLRALDDLVRQGKVRYIGTSMFRPWQLVETLWYSERERLERVVSEQTPYSVLFRHVEKELQQVASKYGIGLMTFGALGHSLLTGKYRRGETPSPGSRADLRGWDFSDSQSAERFLVVEGFLGLANGTGVPPTQLAVAWVLSNPNVTSVITGPKTATHVGDALAALEVSVGDAELERVDELVAPGTAV